MPLKSLSKVSVGASGFNRLPNGFKRSSKLTQTMPIDGDNVASIRVIIGTTAVGTGTFNRSATTGVTIGVTASGQQTDQQHFGTATVGVVISSTASASVTSTHSGTATASIVITTTAAGETGGTHSGTANIGVTISVTASGTASQTHAGVASVQVNLSASASGINANTTVPDETSNGNNMTLVNGALFTSDSAVGSRATDFDGTNDYAQFSSTYQSVLRSSFSFSLWVRLEVGHASFNKLLMNFPHGDSSNPEYIQFFTQNSYFKAYYRAGGSYISVNQTTGPLPNGDSGWLHLVLVGIRTSSTDHTLKIYKNGSEVASNDSSTVDFEDFTTTEKIAIGRGSSSSGSQTYHAFKVDDVSIWSKALSSTEVSNLYNSGSGSSLTGSSDLEGWWKMGEHSVVPITHSGTATVSVGVTASASGDLLELHSGTASCQVNLSATASGTVVAAFNSYSLEFDGTNDHLSTSLVTNTYNLKNGFTASLWVKLDDNSTTQDFFGRYGNSTGRFYFGITGSKVRAAIGTSFNTSTLSHGMSTGTWYHVAYTFSGGSSGTFTYYLNGSSVGTISFTWTTDSASYEPMHIGGLKNGGNLHQNPTNGKLDEFALYNSALSASDITAIYNSGAPADQSSDSDLVAYWRMEENTGTTVADSSSNSNTATLTNGPTFNTDVPS